MGLRERYLALGAELAPDGIPLHFGDQVGEYRAAYEGAVIFDRSHEARLELGGRDGLALIDRISTNKVVSLSAGQGAATVFLNANARVLERAVVFHWREAGALLLGGAGRAGALRQYLQRNIFYNDLVELGDLSVGFHAWAVHGVGADALLAGLGVDLPAGIAGQWVEVAGAQVFAGRLKPFIGAQWVILAPVAQAEAVWERLVGLEGLRPSGGLVYNALRIAAGVPGPGRELTGEYIPLEVGLWDEISFNKGCYTGQEIIARMESRNKLARTLVRVRLAGFVESPAELSTPEGQRIGQLTSSVIAPDGAVHAMGVVRLAAAQVGQRVMVGGVAGEISGFLGALPPMVEG